MKRELVEDFHFMNIYPEQAGKLVILLHLTLGKVSVIQHFYYHILSNRFRMNRKVRAMSGNCGILTVRVP